jgi:hypothetical protein
LLKVINAKEQEEPISWLCVIRTGKGRVLVSAPFMQAKQDRSIRIEDLPKVVVGRLSGWQAEERLIPGEAAMDVRDADDCPCPPHDNPPAA